MSQRRKHVTTNSLQDDVQPPGPGERIVKAAGTRGGNIVEVEYPDGSRTLCMMPAKFNKKLWVRKGGYLIIEDSAEAAEDDQRVTGQIVYVLYDEHIKQLKRLPGVWPPEFGSTQPSCIHTCGDASVSSLPAEECVDADDDSGSESDLPPIFENRNKRTVYHEDSDEQASGDDGPG